LINKAWVDLYRPNTLSECILTDELYNKFYSFVRTESIPNLILVGPSGIGKTSVAVAMLKDLDCDYYKVNASIKGIDLIRDEVMQFCSTVSFVGKKKYVIFDEADGLSVAAQDALKTFIEEYANNAGFIFTCNSLNKLIPAIQSRNMIINFVVSKNDFPTLAKNFYKKVETILNENNVVFEKQVIGPVIKKFFPDWRKILIVLQEYAITHNNIIDNGILGNKDLDTLDELIGFIKSKQWENARKWVGENNDCYVDFASFLRKLYDEIKGLLQSSSLPVLTVRMNEFDFQHYFVADKENNVIAFITKIMTEIVFK
jgi:replication factor C small subunit